MISGSRVQDRLDEIYSCGKQKDGTYSRIAFSEEDKKGRSVFIAYAEKLGLKTHLDVAGNLIARWEGSNKTLSPIMIGSHMDTVPDGGKYDGVYGCVGALEVVESLIEEGIQLKHPIELIVFADEEGICFGKGLSGSNALSGQPLEGFHAEDKDANGKLRKDVMKIYNVDFDYMKDAARKREEIACFLEMHVEQGRTLERNGQKIGVVTTIAGVSRYNITVIGETNHSGSTMMQDRKDALVGAAEFISGVPEIVTSVGSEYAVGTVGKLTVTPGSVNVIPGQVTFSLEIREQTDHNRKKIEQALFGCLDKICERNGLTYETSLIASYPCAPMDEKMIQAFDFICEKHEIPHRKMPSGAFHDAMFMTRTFVTGMIFVPSRNGISHSRQEYTSVEDLQIGCEVLFDTLKYLDECLE